MTLRLRKNQPGPSAVHTPSIMGQSGRLGLNRKKRRYQYAKADPGLYVCRPVTDETDQRLRLWAEEQGLPPLDPHLHVTVVHSETEIPWAPAGDTVLVTPDHYQHIGTLGRDQAVVLFFEHPELRARWALAREQGARWDYEGFRCHLTLFYDPAFFDHRSTQPVPTFPLVLGPEVAGSVHKDVFKLDTGELVERECPIVKVDAERQLVYGFASVITKDDGSYEEDTQGDVIFEEDLLDAAHQYMRKSRQIGLNHRIKSGIGEVVESVVLTRDVQKALGVHPPRPVAWFIGAHVANPEIWARVRSGELAAFSIGGTGDRIPLISPGH